MNDMIEVKTADLTGTALDWAVAKAEGLKIYIADPEYGTGYRVCVELGIFTKSYNPSTEWSQGGPLIEKHTLRVAPHVQSNGVITSWAADMTWPCNTMPGRCGKTPLVAACRAIVMKELGSVLMVPKELVQ